jgi:hypothetical protein
MGKPIGRELVLVLWFNNNAGRCNPLRRMNTTKKILAVVAILLFIATGVMLQRALRVNQRRWVVLEQPIRLDEGFSFSNSFTVDIPTTYYLGVECKKTVPSDTLNATLYQALAVEFSLSNGATNVAHGDSSKIIGGAGANDFVSVEFAKFEATPGVTYTLDFHVLHSLPQLASTCPLVKVSVHPSVFKNAAVNASVSIFEAYGLAFVGLLCALSALGSILFRRHNDKTRNS